jgi:hypothetical protein
MNFLNDHKIYQALASGLATEMMPCMKERSEEIAKT